MSGPSRALADQRRAVAGQLADLPPGSLVLVACSGGADSLALAAATAHVARLSHRRGIVDGAPLQRLRAGAVVVDHGVRPDAGAVAGRAAGACRELGLDPVRVVDAQWGTGGEPGRGGEGAARDARHAALEAAAGELGASAVLLGHTLDDQAETVLLALARGSGPTALAGMPPQRGLLRRPFLEVRRADTRAACAQAGLVPDEDPTNAADGPWRAADGSALRRAAVRERALPELSRSLGLDVAPALAATARRIRADEALLASLAAELATRVRVEPSRHEESELGSGNELGTNGTEGPDGANGTNGTEGTEGVVRLDVAGLAAAPAPLADRVLHAALLEAGAPPGQVGRRHVARLRGLLERRGRGAADLPRVRAWREEGNGEGPGARGTLVCARRDDDEERKHDGRQRHG